MQLTNEVEGVFAIAPTPFRDDGQIDETSIDRLVDFYEGAGCAGITALGMMGEAPKLDAAEALRVATRMVRRSTRLPVVIGVSSPGFASMRALAHSAMDAGASAVMIAPPPSVRTDDQIANYFTGVAEVIGNDTPFVVQDFPQANGVQISPTVIKRIVLENKSCIMLKHEDWPGLEKISALRRFERDGSMRHISILCGNGGLFLDFEMERGADGAMTGYAFPEMLVGVVKLSRSGDHDAAHDLFDFHLPLVRYEQQPAIGLAVRKHILKRRGVIRTDVQRKPSTHLSELALKEIDYLLKRVQRQTAPPPLTSEPRRWT